MGPGGIVRQKRLSKFRQMKEEAVEAKPEKAAASSPEALSHPETSPPVVSAAVQKDVKGKGKADDQAGQPPSIPAPVHTISLSTRPSEPSKEADGTISYADIPFDSDEDVDEEDPYSDEEGFDWSDDDDEIDDDDLDVDAALHAREVALAYHQQRLNVGGGRGTGALGGYHDVGESPFAGIADSDAQGVRVIRSSTYCCMLTLLLVAARPGRRHPSIARPVPRRPRVRYLRSRRLRTTRQALPLSPRQPEPRICAAHHPFSSRARSLTRDVEHAARSRRLSRSA